MKTSFSRKLVLCLLPFLSVAILSCGVSKKSRLPHSSGEGGGSGIIPPPPTSSLVANPLALNSFFNATVEEIGTQSQNINFTAIQDSITNFILVLNAGQNASDWNIVGKKLSDSSACAGPNQSVALVAGDICSVTITFKPKSLARYNGNFNANLTYTYKNNLGVQQTPQPIPILSKAFQPLVGEARTNINQFQNTMSNFVSSLFVGSTFIGLSAPNSSNINPNNLFTFNVTTKTSQQFKQIATNVPVVNYGLTTMDSNNLFYKILGRSNYIISKNATNPGMFGVPGGTLIGDGTTAIVQVVSDGNKMYGANDSGQVYSIASSGTATLMGTAPLPSGQASKNRVLSADNAGNVYGIFNDKNTPANYFLCRVSTFNNSCSQNKNNFINVYSMIANNNNIFLFTLTPNEGSKTLGIMWFDINLNQNFYVPKSITADYYLTPVYDAENNILYVISIYHSIYTLTEIDFNEKLQSSYNFNPQEGIISRPFLTTGQSKRVVVVSSTGRIFIFTKDKLTPFIFNDQNSFYQLPTNGNTKFYSNLASIYNNSTNSKTSNPTLFIPSYEQEDSQTNYLFPLN